MPETSEHNNKQDGLSSWRLFVSKHKTKIIAAGTAIVTGVVGVIAGDTGLVDTVVQIIKSVFGG